MDTEPLSVMTAPSRSEGEISDRDVTDRTPAPVDIPLPSENNSAYDEEQEPGLQGTARSSSPTSAAGHRTPLFDAALRTSLPASREPTSPGNKLLESPSRLATSSSPPVSVADSQISSFDVAPDTALSASDVRSPTRDTDTPSTQLASNPPLEPNNSDQFIVEDLWNGDHRHAAAQLMEKIEKMSKWLPHLRILFSRHGPNPAAFGRIKTCCIAQDGTFLGNLNDVTLGNEPKWEHIRDHFLREPLERNTNRIILVEDLSPQVIIGLYAAFGLGPEIFADHLTRSGYGTSTYEDPDPSTWSFRSVSKTYVSLRWFRAVYKSERADMPTAARVNFERSKFTEWKEKKLTSTDAGEQPRRAKITHILERLTNILRKQRPLSALVTPSPDKPLERHTNILRQQRTPPASVTSSPDKVLEKTLATIEERITLHKVQRNGHELSKCRENWFYDKISHLYSHSSGGSFAICSTYHRNVLRGAFRSHCRENTRARSSPSSPKVPSTGLIGR